MKMWMTSFLLDSRALMRLGREGGFKNLAAIIPSKIKKAL
jgi:hypothetical protein